jgi:hypothetical protein
MNKVLYPILVVFIFCQSLSAQIKVSDNGRYLATKDGEPFFWLGDTNWEMFHRLTREEIILLMDTRAKQGFNVLLAVALAEEDGLRTPNRYGDWPLNNEDPAQLLVTPGNDPNNSYEYDYWDHVDFAIDEAAKRGLYIGFLPTWGDKVAHLWGVGPIVFNPGNAEVFARTLAQRYADKWNILWILGGDRPAVYKSRDGKEKMYDDRPVWRAMAKGIEDVLGRDAFITYHPSGGRQNASSQHLHNDPWLDMNAFQTSHGSREVLAWEWIQQDLALNPLKPTMDMEPCYEDHPVNPWDGKWTRESRGYFVAYDVRARMYRGVFAGGCGATYGHHQIWQFFDPDLFKPVNIGDTIIGWKKALHAEAAGQMQYMKNLMLSRPYFSRLPDQSLIKSKNGTTYVDHITATRDENGSYAMFYLPQNRPISVDMEKITGTEKRIWWFDPRTGDAIEGKPVRSRGTTRLTPPGHGQDWILVIDDASKKYNAPGK